MEKTDQNGDFSCFEPFFNPKKPFWVQYFYFFWNVKYRKESFFLTFIRFFEKSMGNNIPQIKKKPANKHCADFFRIFAQDKLHLSN